MTVKGNWEPPLLLLGLLPKGGSEGLREIFRAVKHLALIIHSATLLNTHKVVPSSNKTVHILPFINQEVKIAAKSLQAHGKSP